MYLQVCLEDMFGRPRNQFSDSYFLCQNIKQKFKSRDKRGAASVQSNIYKKGPSLAFGAGVLEPSFACHRAPLPQSHCCVKTGTSGMQIWGSVTELWPQPWNIKRVLIISPNLRYMYTTFSSGFE